MKNLIFSCMLLSATGVAAAAQSTPHAESLAHKQPDRVQSLSAWLQHFTHGKPDAYRLTQSDGQAGYIVAALYPASDTTPDQGHLLLLQPHQQGFTLHMQVPQQGALPDTVMETIDAFPTQFLLHYTAFSPCGGVSTSYRFGLRAGNWVLTGIDQVSGACLSNGGIGTEAKLSKNVLTGKVIRQDYRDGKAQPEQISTEKFGLLLLRDFVPFDDRHGELL